MRRVSLCHLQLKNLSEMFKSMPMITMGIFKSKFFFFFLHKTGPSFTLLLKQERLGSRQKTIPCCGSLKQHGTANDFLEQSNSVPPSDTRVQKNHRTRSQQKLQNCLLC